MSSSFSETVQLIVSAGASMNTQNNVGNTAIMEYMKYIYDDLHYGVVEIVIPYYESIAYLIHHGADLWIRNNEGRDAMDILMLYRIRDYHPIVAELIDMWKQHYQNTDLMFMARYGHYFDTRYIKNVDAQNIDGLTALMHALQIPNEHTIRTIEKLIDVGSNVALGDILGRTLLHHAILNRVSADVLKAMLAYPHISNLVNVVDNNGSTPIHCSSTSDTVEILMSVPGIDLNIVDKHGKSAREIATSRLNNEIIL
jgi:ankyrin repeat protein